jgi:hypothetical protein
MALPEIPTISFKGNSAEDWGDGGGSYDVRMIFWDRDGNLRIGTSLRDRDEECLAVLKADDNDTEEPDTIWVIIPARWARKWALFAHLRLTSEEPGPIDMRVLQVADPTESLGWRPRFDLIPAVANDDMNSVEPNPGHYRRVTLHFFQELEKLYGVIGHPIAVWGNPSEDVLRWRMFENSAEIGRDMLPVGEEMRIILEKSKKRREVEAIASKEKEEKVAGGIEGFFKGLGGGMSRMMSSKKK